MVRNTRVLRKREKITEFGLNCVSCWPPWIAFAVFTGHKKLVLYPLLIGRDIKPPKVLNIPMIMKSLCYLTPHRIIQIWNSENLFLSRFLLTLLFLIFWVLVNQHTGGVSMGGGGGMGMGILFVLIVFWKVMKWRLLLNTNSS